MFDGYGAVCHDANKEDSIDGYPLKVEYSITPRGQKMLEAITIMQSIGIELMLEDGKEDLLKQMGLLR